MKKRLIQVLWMLIALCLLFSLTLSVYATQFPLDPFGSSGSSESSTQSSDCSIPASSSDTSIPTDATDNTAPTDSTGTTEAPVEPDTVIPELKHEPILYGKVGQALNFQAIATDDVAVTEVRLLYRCGDAADWTEVGMDPGDGNVYTTMLDETILTAATMEYYIEASDGVNVASTEHYTIHLDKGISISTFSIDKVSIANAADTPLIITGEGFTEGMRVTIGGAEATYELLSETGIKVTVPALAMGKADVVIANGENICTRLQAITYYDPESFVRVSAPEKVYIGQKVGFPITIGGNQPVTEILLKVKLNSAYFENIQFILGVANLDITSSCEVSPDGTATIRIQSKTALTIAEPIGYITAKVPNIEANATSFISIESASFHGVDVKIFDCPVNVSRDISVNLLNVPSDLSALQGVIPEFTGWMLEIDYEGLKEVISVTKDMVSISQEIPGQGKVTYFHKEVVFTYLVMEPELSTVTVKAPPAKLNYIVGEELDLTGMEVEFSYKEGTIIQIVQNYTVSGYDPEKQGVQTITVQYGDLYCTFDLTVFVKGDVNCDGKITILDMVTIKSHVLNISQLTGQEALAADFNGDGKISILDYVQIKAVILGLTGNDSEEGE